MQLFPQQQESARADQIESLESFSVWDSYFFVALHPSIWPHLARFLRTVIADFFWLQFSQKLKIRRIKVVQIDHALDTAVPFAPQKIDTYLDFVNFWIRPLSLLVKKRPAHAARYFCRYLELINMTYAQAARFYKFRMSTTHRPKGFANAQIFIVKMLDPHFLCVPSLHVSVMVLAYAFFKDAFRAEDFTETECLFYTNELKRGAIEIAETVLYVKQHSVNCIAAALYMMNYILEDRFTIQDAVNFINALFAESEDITAENKRRINEHLLMLFEQLLLEGKNETDWIVPLKRWILRYEQSQNR